MVKRFEDANGIWYIKQMEISFKTEESVDIKKKGIKIFLALVIACSAFGVRYSGLVDNIDLEKIRTFINGYGYLGPVFYILTVSLAPTLFLPGAPFIIAGGILFGSFWGIVYGITGATTGACLAFLVSRYILRDWIDSKLTSPTWIKLKNQTEEHGWKIVAITRLIPLIPFNLLSYGLGLTRIKFSHYFITSFICMLPGCIAYILLSNSIINLVKGEITIEFITGFVLILILSLIPILFKKKIKHS